MSKTSQQKASLYQQGYNDGSIGNGVRWSRHPHLAEYMRGYRKGTKDANDALDKWLSADRVILNKARGLRIYHV